MVVPNEDLPSKLNLSDEAKVTCSKLPQSGTPSVSNDVMGSQDKDVTNTPDHSDPMSSAAVVDTHKLRRDTLNHSDAGPSATETDANTFTQPTRDASLSTTSHDGNTVQQTSGSQATASVSIRLDLSGILSNHIRGGSARSRPNASGANANNHTNQRVNDNNAAGDGGANHGQNQAQRQQPHNRNILPLYGREGIFMNYLFINIALRYANFFKSTARRLIEFFSLANAVGMLTVLIYVHVTFVKNGSDCLGHLQDIWPQTGILRVQVSNNASLPKFKFYFIQESFSNSITVEASPFDAVLQYSVPLSYRDITDFNIWQKIIAESANDQPKPDSCLKVNHFKAMVLGLWQKQCPVLKKQYLAELRDSFTRQLHSLVLDTGLNYNVKENMITKLNQEILKYENVEVHYSPFEPSVVRDFYAIEYSEEFGYLRLSAEARSKLAIPTLVVNLNPKRDECFAGPVKRFVLDMFIGYDDYIMSSIKRLGESSQSHGYLHNIVTGEYFRFVTVWVNHATFIALLAMMVFTLVVTMLLRYSYHQIFMFMVDLLRLLDADVRLVFPAAPMLTIILALVGMEEIMTEFFHDSTIAFYIILLIWIADQFDTICLHTVISRRHWIRFFYLYHFTFYIYHYQFNGQYSKLALFTSWLFIVHSMIYFIHHYELPAIQSQLALIHQRNRARHSRRDHNHGDDNPSGENTSTPFVPAQESPSEHSPENGSSETSSTFTDSHGSNRSPQFAADQMDMLFTTLKYIKDVTSQLLRLLWCWTVSLNHISKWDMCKLCLFVLLCIGVAVISSTTIQCSLSHASHLELVKIDDFV